MKRAISTKRAGRCDVRDLCGAASAAHRLAELGCDATCLNSLLRQIAEADIPLGVSPARARRIAVLIGRCRKECETLRTELRGPEPLLRNTVRNSLAVSTERISLSLADAQDFFESVRPVLDRRRNREMVEWVGRLVGHVRFRTGASHYELLAVLLNEAGPRTFAEVTTYSELALWIHRNHVQPVIEEAVCDEGLTHGEPSFEELELEERGFLPFVFSMRGVPRPRRKTNQRKR
jgi:hypothetical protein